MTVSRTPNRRPPRGVLAAVAALVLLAACGSGDAKAAGQAAAFLPAADPAPGATAAPRDSLAEWRARFGGRVPRPDSVRALYVNGWAAGSRARMRELIRIAEETEINAFIIDIKESDTYLTYDSTGVALAREIGADTRPASRWLPALVDTLQARGIYSIARIVVFKDRVLAERKPELAIRSTSGGTWLDQNGKPWVNPYDRRVWDYNVALAREALEMGFSELQWDYVRFPDVNGARRRAMVFPGAGGVSHEDNIAAFLRYSKERLEEFEVPIAADVFGLASHVDGDVGIGQNWEKVIAEADVVLPMAYPSHYYRGMYGFDHPVAHPYEILRISMQDAVDRTRWVSERGTPTGEVMPWLEAQTASWVKPTVEYGPAELRQQIQATYDAGLKSWALWNPGSRYERYLPALRPAAGGPSPLERGGWQPRRWEPPMARRSVVVRRRVAAERAAAQARDSAAAGAAPAPGGAGETAAP